MRSNLFCNFCKTGLFFALVIFAPTAQATGNLLSNPDFELNTTGWDEIYPDENSVITYDTSHDHDDVPGVVGSLKLEISIANGGGRGPGQCVVVSSAMDYLAAGAIYRPTQSAEAELPSPYIKVSYHDDATCSYFRGYSDTGALLGDLVDDWYDIEFEVTPNASAGSAYFQLISGGTHDSTFTTVYFDNLYLPEPGNNLLIAVAAVVLFTLGYLRRKPTALG